MPSDSLRRTDTITSSALLVRSTYFGSCRPHWSTRAFPAMLLDLLDHSGSVSRVDFRSTVRCSSGSPDAARAVAGGPRRRGCWARDLRSAARGLAARADHGDCREATAPVGAHVVQLDRTMSALPAKRRRNLALACSMGVELGPEC